MQPCHVPPTEEKESVGEGMCFLLLLAETVQDLLPRAKLITSFGCCLHIFPYADDQAAVVIGAAWRQVQHHQLKGCLLSRQEGVPAFQLRTSHFNIVYLEYNSTLM